MQSFTARVVANADQLWILERMNESVTAVRQGSSANYCMHVVHAMCKLFECYQRDTGVVICACWSMKRITLHWKSDPAPTCLRVEM